MEDLRQYYNIHRAHASLGGDTPSEISGETTLNPATLSHFRWKSHCRGLYPALSGQLANCWSAATSEVLILLSTTTGSSPHPQSKHAPAETAGSMNLIATASITLRQGLLGHVTSYLADHVKCTLSGL
jgi:hypothetical protein